MNRTGGFLLVFAVWTVLVAVLFRNEGYDAGYQTGVADGLTQQVDSLDYQIGDEPAFYSSPLVKATAVYSGAGEGVKEELEKTAVAVFAVQEELSAVSGVDETTRLLANATLRAHLLEARFEIFDLLVASGQSKKPSWPFPQNLRHATVPPLTPWQTAPPYERVP